MIDLYTAPGIGDIYWILCKLSRHLSGEKIRIHVPAGDGPKFIRSKFLEFLPFVDSCIADGPQYRDIVKSSKQYDRIESSMTIEVNTWLEEGNRLEDFMPDFEMEYALPWRISEGHKWRAQSYLHSIKKNVVIYTSGIGNNDNPSTGEWDHKRWAPILWELASRDDVNLIWIGADYDADILDYLKMGDNMISVINEPSPVIIHLLRCCDKFISYQSGLSCISVMESIPTYMMYFKKIDALRYTFCPDSSLSNRHIYAADFFDDVSIKSVVDWVDS